jgi:hypothetical protein
MLAIFLQTYWFARLNKSSPLSLCHYVKIVVWFMLGGNVGLVARMYSVIARQISVVG